MSVMLQIAGIAGDVPGTVILGWETGRYLKQFDVAACHGREPSFPMTTDKAEAARFPDLTAAFEFWRTQSRVMPLRPDGEPNRPLTCFSVRVVRAFDA